MKNTVNDINETVVKCCICGEKVLYQWSCNPEPLYTGLNEYCCGDCNLAYIIPERLRRLNGRAAQVGAQG